MTTDENVERNREDAVKALRKWAWGINEQLIDQLGDERKRRYALRELASALQDLAGTEHEV